MTLCSLRGSSTFSVHYKQNESIFWLSLTLYGPREVHAVRLLHYNGTAKFGNQQNLCLQERGTVSNCTISSLCPGKSNIYAVQSSFLKERGLIHVSRVCYSKTNAWKLVAVPALGIFSWMITERIMNKTEAALFFFYLSQCFWDRILSYSCSSFVLVSLVLIVIAWH